MENTKKFTQEVKDEWVEALESGNYTQGFGQLQYEDALYSKLSHCCMGVLGDLHPGLNNEVAIESESVCVYHFLKKNDIDYKKIWNVNDNFETKPEKLDYSNVIKIIKNLPVKK